MGRSKRTAMEEEKWIRRKKGEKEILTTKERGSIREEG